MLERLHLQGVGPAPELRFELAPRINIVTGDRMKLGLELAKHDAVDAIWSFGPRDMAEAFEKASAGNLKQTWCETVTRDWSSDAESAGRDTLAHATQVKNVWIPYGE